MEKIKKILIVNYLDILIILGFFIVFGFLMFVFKGYLGNFIFDSGREAYLPQEVLKGKVLYKDIFNYFGPLSYQLNAFLYSIFGVNLTTLYIAGAVNSIIILACVYFITRVFTTKLISYLVTFLIMFVCVFKSVSNFNFIFLYSYAMIYALSTFLLSALFLIYYLKTSRAFFVPLSWFFIGISIASKYEYLIYVFLLAILTFLIKPVEKKYILYSILGFLSTPFLCFSILFLQGLTVTDLITSLNITKKYCLSSSLHYYYRGGSGLYPDKIKLFHNGLLCSIFISSFSFLIMSIYTFVLGKRRKLGKHLMFLILVVLGFAAGCFCSLVISKGDELFSFFPILILAIGVGFILTCIRKQRQYYEKNNKRAEKNIRELKDFCSNYFSTTEGVYLITILIALTSCIKSFYNLNLNLFGTFSLPLVLIVAAVFFVEYLPCIFKSLDKNLWQNSTGIVLIISSFLYFLLHVLYFNLYYGVPIEGNGNKLYYYKAKVAKASIAVIDYINKEIKPSSSFVVFPEGLMFNFLTNHPSNDIYYTALLPPHIEAFGENNIIKGLSNAPPDYIFIHNLNLYMYKDAVTCENSGLKVCAWIYKNYSKEKVFDNDGFKITVYKKL